MKASDIDVGQFSMRVDWMHKQNKTKCHNNGMLLAIELAWLPNIKFDE